MTTNIVRAPYVRTLSVKSGVKAGAGGWDANHSGKRLVVKTGTRAGLGGDGLNHNATRLVVKTRAI